MRLQDISHFSKTSDYLPLLNGAIITDLFVILRLILGQFQSTTLRSWYNLYGIAGVLADVLSIVIGIVIARFIYPFFFRTFSWFTFCIVAVSVQMIHDLLFAQLFMYVPRGKSRILDTFKDYANEMGATILLADAAMILSTIFLGAFFASLSPNTNILILIVSLYLVPYFLYSI